MLWKCMHPQAHEGHLGYIPQFLSEDDPRSAAAQINERYVFGGWSAFKGFKMQPDGALKYTGDPALQPLYETQLRDETIRVYESA